MDTQSIKSSMKKKQSPLKVKSLLSTGSTLLNLACSGRPEGGFLKGHYYFVVGDSSSGKTFLGLTCFAEAVLNPQFDDYRLIYDGVEGGAIMDIERFFGKGVAERLEAPAGTKTKPKTSYTVEEFYFHLKDVVNEGEPFIYILDSQDALTSEAEVGKFDERKKAHEKGKGTTGTYGDNKAKVHSQNLRKFMGPLAELNSILVILNQTRDSFSLFEQGTYSGGRALKFYATLQLWGSVAGKLSKTYRGKKRQLGIRSKIKVVKNRMTGKDRMVEVPIYHSYGIDDMGSCVDYLVSEGVWKRNNSGVITVEGVGPSFSGRMDDVVARIEEQHRSEDVRDLVADTWNDVEKACEVKRRRRYR